MVKKSRNERVWEVPKIKERKKRTVRVKEQVESQKSSYQSVYLQQEQQQKAQISNNVCIINEKNQEVHSKRKEIQSQQEGVFSQQQEVYSQQEEKVDQSNKQMNQQEKKNKIIVKDILLSDFQTIQGQEGTQLSFCYRPEQEHAILSFVLSQAQRKVPDWLYIYGPPGIGKTYLIKNILRRQQLSQKAVWFNCYSILQKSKLKYSKNKARSQKDKQIVIIDEFDQLQSLILTQKFKYKFLQFIQELNADILVEKAGLIKYILISNKSYHSLQTQALESIKQIMKCEKITERPFLPYNLKSVQAIIEKKLKQVQAVLPEFRFNFKLVQIAVNKMYNASQDIRGILAFIIEDYQSLLILDKNSNLSQKELRINFLNEINLRKNEKNEAQSMICKYLRGLNPNQKHLLRQIVIQYEEASKQHQDYRIQSVYRQGRKKKISQQTVDVWLQEWSQMQIITKKRIYPRFEHYLFPVYAVRTDLTYKQFRPYLN